MRQRPRAETGWCLSRDWQYPVLRGIYPRINVIAVTGYSKYALPAHRIHVSGFLEKPVTAEEIYRNVWANEPNGNAKNTVRVHVSSLRKKLKIKSGGFCIIEMQRGSGYRLMVME